jgi:predicted Zn-dependent protease
MKLKITAFFFLACLILAEPSFSKEASPDTVDVYIVPLEDFPEEAAAIIAKTMSKDMNMWAKGTLKLGAFDIAKLPGTNQLISEDILEKSQSVLKRLPESSDKTYYMLLTTKDINSRTGGNRFAYSTHNKGLNTSVVSLARLMNYANGQPVLDNLALTRLYKMVKRAIGEMHLGWKRSINIDDIMYSPIMGLQDLDRIGINHTETPSKVEKSKRLDDSI